MPELQSGSSAPGQPGRAGPHARSSPVRPRTKLNVALGLLLGLMLGVGLAFLREFLDRSVKTPEELEAAAGAPGGRHDPAVQGGQAAASRWPSSPAPPSPRRSASCAPTSRSSASTATASAVSSPRPSAADGKSTVAANLAIALAQAGQRVAVVDADLRKPTLHKLFDLPQRVGTTTVLLDQADVHDALQHLGPGFPAVLTSGQLPPNPSELLGSRRMEELLAELRATYEVVLIDCAPLLPVTDPMVVSRFADGMLLIARAGTTTRDQAAAAKAACPRPAPRFRHRPERHVGHRGRPARLLRLLRRGGATAG